MNDASLPTGDGHTELSEQDRKDLIPSHIATRGDLFDAEQRNNAEALLARPPSLEKLLDDKYLRDLHRAMFGQVWRWAGQFRRYETNIGIEPTQISTNVRELVKDAMEWIDSQTYSADEIAVRFHHRLVAIHPFRDGNGRHGRVAADYLIGALGGHSFGWGRRLDVDTPALRTAYITALRRADAGEFDSLLEFARS